MWRPLFAIPKIPLLLCLTEKFSSEKTRLSLYMKKMNRHDILWPPTPTLSFSFSQNLNPFLSFSLDLYNFPLIISYIDASWNQISIDISKNWIIDKGISICYLQKQFRKLIHHHCLFHDIYLTSKKNKISWIEIICTGCSICGGTNY